MKGTIEKVRRCGMEYDAVLDCWICVTMIPPHVDALVREQADGTKIMLINETLSDEKKKEAYEHEKKHLQRGDLHSDEDVKTLEESTRR